MAGDARGILILGGTGFVGSNFANFAAAKDIAVTISGGAKARVPLDSRIAIRPMDATNLCEMRALFAAFAPETVVFCISRLVPRHVAGFDAEIAFTEIRAVLNMLQCAKESGVGQIIYCSSGGAVYEEGEGPRSEDARCQPKTLYGRVKLAAENVIESFSIATGTCTTILRIANPYGPGQSPSGSHGVIPIFMSRILAGKPITVFGSLAAAKDYFFIDDLSAAIWAAIAGRVGGLFNIGSGEPTKLETIVERICEACGKTPRCAFQDLPTTDVQSFVLDVTRARVVLGWHPVTMMPDGIARTRQWLEGAA